MGVLLLIVLIQRIFKGFMATIAVLLGLVVGTLVAWIAGDASFDSVKQRGRRRRHDAVPLRRPEVRDRRRSSRCSSSWRSPRWRRPVTCSRPVRSSRSGSCSDDIARAIRADGLATFIGGIFNSFPYTCFAENVGLVRLTRVTQPLGRRRRPA